MIVPSLLDFYYYGFPLFGLGLLYVAYREGQRYVHRKWIQFVLENYST